MVFQTTPKLPFVPYEEVISVLSKFVFSFFFWTYLLDNSNTTLYCSIVNYYNTAKLNGPCTTIQECYITYFDSKSKLLKESNETIVQYKVISIWDFEIL
jgi:hypothetical protein